MADWDNLSEEVHGKLMSLKINPVFIQSLTEVEIIFKTLCSKLKDEGFGAVQKQEVLKGLSKMKAGKKASIFIQNCKGYLDGLTEKSELLQQEHLLCSPDIIESYFGKFKAKINPNNRSGLTEFIFTTATFGQSFSEQEAKKALQSIKCKYLKLYRNQARAAWAFFKKLPNFFALIIQPKIDISNNCSVGFFTDLEVQIETEGVIFGAIENGDPGNWGFVPDGQQNMVWFPRSQYIPAGISENIIRFCLDGIGEESQVPQTISFNWLVSGFLEKDSIYCSDTLEFNCPIDSISCLDISEVEICLGGDDFYEMTFTVENTSTQAFDAAQINIFSPDEVYIYGGVVQLDPELAFGQSQDISVLLFTDPFPFNSNQFEFFISTKDVFGEECCQEFEQLIVPVPSPDSCVTSAFEYIRNFEAVIFPNPFAEGFTILFQEPINNPLQLTLRDIYGRQLYADKLPAGSRQMQMQPGDTPAGVYMLEFRNGEANIAVRKLVKQ